MGGNRQQIFPGFDVDLKRGGGGVTQSHLNNSSHAWRPSTVDKLSQWREDSMKTLADFPKPWYRPKQISLNETSRTIRRGQYIPGNAHLLLIFIETGKLVLYHLDIYRFLLSFAFEGMVSQQACHSSSHTTCQHTTQPVNNVNVPYNTFRTKSSFLPINSNACLNAFTKKVNHDVDKLSQVNGRRTYSNLTSGE